ncbi:MAG: BrnT family toxin [Elusimicrobia bacterium]|nr:BrnT family toxin [Elusimicrobiota bacterium]
MKFFSWDPDKNEWLKVHRGVSFEEVVFHIEKDGLLAIAEHHNKAKYPTQQLFVVNIDGYAFLVPFVENEHEIFLKTIIPSRKATRDYLGGEPHV